MKRQSKTKAQLDTSVFDFVDAENEIPNQVQTKATKVTKPSRKQPLKSSQSIPDTCHVPVKSSHSARVNKPTQNKTGVKSNLDPSKRNGISTESLQSSQKSRAKQVPVNRGSVVDTSRSIRRQLLGQSNAGNVPQQSLTHQHQPTEKSRTCKMKDNCTLKSLYVKPKVQKGTTDKKDRKPVTTENDVTASVQLGDSGFSSMNDTISPRRVSKRILGTSSSVNVCDIPSLQPDDKDQAKKKKNTDDHGFYDFSSNKENIPPSFELDTSKDIKAAKPNALAKSYNKTQGSKSLGLKRLKSPTSTPASSRLTRAQLQQKHTDVFTLESEISPVQKVDTPSSNHLHGQMLPSPNGLESPFTEFTSTRRNGPALRSSAKKLGIGVQKESQASKKSQSIPRLPPVKNLTTSKSQSSTSDNNLSQDCDVLLQSAPPVVKSKKNLQAGKVESKQSNSKPKVSSKQNNRKPKVASKQSDRKPIAVDQTCTGQGDVNIAPSSPELFVPADANTSKSYQKRSHKVHAKCIEDPKSGPLLDEWASKVNQELEEVESFELSIE